MILVKIILGFVIAVALAVILNIAVTFIANLIDAIYSRECIVDTIDQIVRLFKCQQVLLADIGIPVRFTISRALFTDNVLKVYSYMNDAYKNDIERVKDNYSKEHIDSTKLSYEDNVNSINILLRDYESYNVRYCVDVDKLLFINKLFPQYRFLDTDIGYMNDHGISKTGAGI